VIAKNDYESLSSQKPQKSAFMMLYEFGFTDFLVNDYLLTKHNDANLVAEMLMTGQVDDEAIKTIYEAAAAQKKQ